MAAPETKSSALTRFLFVLFLLAMVMGTGPGTLLVNRAVTVQGIPLLYLWGILWYVVLVAIALVAYFRIWKADTDDRGEGDSA
jgi:hypothetical protein